MTDTTKATADTWLFEGYRASPYKDTKGLWTFAAGRCLERNPLTAAEWKYLLNNGMISVLVNPQGAHYLLQNDLGGSATELSSQYPGFSALPDLVQTLLAEMAYQLGMSGLLEFTTFNQLVQSRQWAAAAQDLRGTKWYTETPARAETIAKQLEGVTG